MDVCLLYGRRPLVGSEKLGWLVAAGVSAVAAELGREGATA
jgi:hypothetical protein